MLAEHGLDRKDDIWKDYDRLKKILCLVCQFIQHVCLYPAIFLRGKERDTGDTGRCRSEKTTCKPDNNHYWCKW